MTDDFQNIVSAVFSDLTPLARTYADFSFSYYYIAEALEDIALLPDPPPESLAKAIERVDRAGKLIDIITDVLIYKLIFTTDFLSITCAPVDVIASLAYKDTNYTISEQILQLEVLRRILVTLK